jgi:hypothetical protein
MANFLSGTWDLIGWRRIADNGSITYPLGEDARGLLIYADNGRMSVHMAAANRAQVPGGDPLGGDPEARAGAYSTYLAYFGSYEVQGQNVVHHIDESLYPSWSDEKQVRPFTLESDQLVLHTPPMTLPDGTTAVNEMAWRRDPRR